MQATSVPFVFYRYCPADSHSHSEEVPIQPHALLGTDCPCADGYFAPHCAIWPGHLPPTSIIRGGAERRRDILAVVPGVLSQTCGHAEDPRTAAGGWTSGNLPTLPSHTLHLHPPTIASTLQAIAAIERRVLADIARRHVNGGTILRTFNGKAGVGSAVLSGPHTIHTGPLTTTLRTNVATAAHPPLQPRTANIISVGEASARLQLPAQSTITTEQAETSEPGHRDLPTTLWPHAATLRTIPRVDVDLDRQTRDTVVT